MIRRLTRIACVQAAYLIELSGGSVEFAIDYFTNTQNSHITCDIDPNAGEDTNTAEKYSSYKFDSKLFAIIIMSLHSNWSAIDSKVSSCIVESWPYDRLELVIKSVLRCATCEMLYLSTPPKVVYNEYLEVLKCFYSTQKEVKFVNGVLRQVQITFLEQKL